MRQDKRTILVLNKIDRMPEKHKLLDIVRRLTDGIVDEQKSHQTLLEIEKERKEEEMARYYFDPREMVRQLIAESDTLVGEGTQYDFL